MSRMEYYSRRHRMIALPCVRVRTDEAGGSGTIIYSKDGATYILTNNHVVADAIRIENKWSPLLKSMRKQDVFQSVSVEMFEYDYESRNIGGFSVQTDIMTYDKEEDLALLKLRTQRDFSDRVAALFPRGEEKRLRIGMPVLVVGAGMGEEPVQTAGVLSQFGQEIDLKEYWLNTAPSIYGNSGGAMFLADEDEFSLVGVPARITVGMFGLDAITHLSFAIPMSRVYKFLEEQRFRFIYDKSFTEAGEAEERRRVREREEEKMAMGSMDAGPDSNSKRSLVP